MGLKNISSPRTKTKDEAHNVWRRLLFLKIIWESAVESGGIDGMEYIIVRANSFWHEDPRRD